MVSSLTDIIIQTITIFTETYNPFALENETSIILHISFSSIKSLFQIPRSYFFLFSDQLEILEKAFANEAYPSTEERIELVRKTQLPEARIQVCVEFFFLLFALGTAVGPEY